MSSVAPAELTVRTARPEDEPAILDLMRLSLGDSESLQRTPALWRWKHVDNPFGPSEVLVVAGPEGAVLGLRAFMRWRFSQGAETMTAVRAVDTATHPDVRRMGLFSRLTLRAVEDVTAQGTGFVFNTPNDQSRPGYLKMGWRSVGLITPLIRVLDPPRFALGLAGRALARKTARVFTQDDFFHGRRPLPASALLDEQGLEELLVADASLWERKLHTLRSRDYLTWRYCNHPAIRYWSATVRQGSRLNAAAVFRTNTRFGLREVVVTEVFVSRRDASLVGALLNEIIRAVHADYAVAYFPQGSFHRTALQRRGFLRAPRTGMTLVANPLNVPFPALADLTVWGLSMGDLEIF